MRLFCLPLFLLSVVVAVTFAACAAPDRATSTSVPATPVATSADDYRGDPALLRRELLRRFDAAIDAQATAAHLQARLTINEVAPIPYLGLDADPAPGGMTVTAVYGGTGAKAAGLEVGDLLLAIGGTKVDSHPTLARAIRHREPGSELVLAVRRGGKDLELRGKLGARPEEDEDEEEQFPDLPGFAPTPLATPRRFAFDDYAIGSTPNAFEVALGGHGATPRWIVVEGRGGRVLRQDSADRTGIHFPLAIATDSLVHDVVARVRVRYAGGEVDQAGGIVLRYRDPGNYYVARVNAAEHDLRIFRVCNGLRRTLPGGIVQCPSAGSDWHTLEFRIEGSKLTATFDGAHTATAYDSFFLGGRCGLWTKSDSQTEFDDLEIEPLPAAK